jgi:hypothetical protein
MPIIIRNIALAHTIVKDVFKIVFALLSSPMPRLMEKIGAPPLPKRLLHAVIIIIKGKQSPTAPRAAVPISGIRPI